MNLNHDEIIEAVKKALDEQSEYKELTVEDCLKHIENFILTGLTGEFSGKPWSHRYGAMQELYGSKYFDEATELGFKDKPLSIEAIRKTLNHYQRGFTEKHCRFSFLSGFFKHLIKLGLLSKSRLSELYEVKPKRNKPPKRKTITDEEIKLILKTVNECPYTEPYDKELFITTVNSAINLGIRIGELCKIELNDIDFTKRELTIPEPKGGKSFTKGFNIETYNLWNKWLKIRTKTESLKLFVLENGKPLTRDTLIQRFRRVSKKLGIDASFHSFRRKYITDMLQSGKSLVDVSLAVNHSSQRMTEQYCIANVQKSIENQKNW